MLLRKDMPQVYHLYKEIDFETYFNVDLGC